MKRNGWRTFEAAEGKAEGQHGVHDCKHFGGAGQEFHDKRSVRHEKTVRGPDAQLQAPEGETRDETTACTVTCRFGIQDTLNNEIKFGYAK